MEVVYGIYVYIYVCVKYTIMHLHMNVLYMYICLLLYFSLNLRDANRLRTIINITSNNLAMSVASSGHLFAISAASAGLSPAANLSERLNGITQVRYCTKYSLSSYKRIYTYVGEFTRLGFLCIVHIGKVKCQACIQKNIRMQYLVCSRCSQYIWHAKTLIRLEDYLCNWKHNCCIKISTVAYGRHVNIL